MVSSRHGTCHKLYMDCILGSEFYPTKYCYLWRFLFEEWYYSQKNNGFFSDSSLNSFNLHNKPPNLHPFMSTARQKITKNITKKKKWIYNHQPMFMGKFYTIEKKFYTDNIFASVKNSISGLKMYSPISVLICPNLSVYRLIFVL